MSNVHKSNHIQYMMGRYKIFKKWHQDDENEELTSFGEVEDEIRFYVEQANEILYS